jgi:hypothetical protein
MSKQATQTKINLSRGIVQAEESTIQDNSLLPAADELKRLVAIDKDLLEWIKRRAEIEQDERVSFNKHRDRKSTRLNSSHLYQSRMPSSA